MVLQSGARRRLSGSPCPPIKDVIIRLQIWRSNNRSQNAIVTVVGQKRSPFGKTHPKISVTSCCRRRLTWDGLRHRCALSSAECSACNIEEKPFLRDSSGAIPPNVLTISNTGNGDLYQKYSRENENKPHPYRVDSLLSDSNVIKGDFEFRRPQLGSLSLFSRQRAVDDLVAVAPPNFTAFH
jgi:hypothetical protein